MCACVCVCVCVCVASMQLRTIMVSTLPVWGFTCDNSHIQKVMTFSLRERQRILRPGVFKAWNCPKTVSCLEMGGVNKKKESSVGEDYRQRGEAVVGVGDSHR